MTMVEESLKTVLTADTALTALVGQRIYRARARQAEETPFVVFVRDGVQRIQSHQGDSGLGRYVLRINSYAKTTLEAQQVADAVRVALRSWTTVQACLPQTETEEYTSDLDLVYISQTYAVWV